MEQNFQNELGETSDALLKGHSILKCAFPEGIEEEKRLELLYCLSNVYSQRNLAELISKTFGTDYYKTLNEIYQVNSVAFKANSERLKQVETLLMNCGYSELLEKENII